MNPIDPVSTSFTARFDALHGPSGAGTGTPGVAGQTGHPSWGDGTMDLWKSRYP